MAGSSRGPGRRATSHKRQHATPDSAFLVAPCAQLLGDFVEIGQYAGGDPDDELEAVILGGTNPVAIDGKEHAAGGPRQSLVSVHQRVVPRQGMQQRGGLEAKIWVSILTEHRRAGARQS